MDKGHCKLLHDGETLIEYDEWWAAVSFISPTGQVIVILMEFIRYDYSTSYPDGEGADKDEEVNKIHCWRNVSN